MKADNMSAFLFGIGSDMMSRIAMTSDNHFDVNRIDSQEMLKQQAEYLVTQQIDYYLIAGDLFNDFQKSMKYVHDLQTELEDATKVLFIAGNHDMLAGVSFEELESIQDDIYVHNKTIDVAGTNWTIIGNNGWYDYSFRPEKTDIDEIELWKQAYWVDRAIQQPMTDIERMQIVLLQTKQQLELAAKRQRQVLYFTHFSPKREYLINKPDIRMWSMANAMMGSYRLGDLLEKEQVDSVLFGHMHIHPARRTYGQTTYYNQSVGYKNKHINEWLTEPFFNQWVERLQVIEKN